MNTHFADKFIDGGFLATKSKFPIPCAIAFLPAGEGDDIDDDYELLDLNDLITGGREGCIAYRVTGDSMLEYIKPGYVVLVDPYCEPRCGDTIVSRINGKNCVKIFDKSSKGLYLVSANKAYKPRRVTKYDDFQILGVVRGHIAIYGR